LNSLGDSKILINYKFIDPYSPDDIYPSYTKKTVCKGLKK